MDEKRLKRAQKVFKSLCVALEENGLEYEKDEDELSVGAAIGDDLPVKVFVTVNAETELITSLSPMPFIVPEPMREKVAIAICLINIRLLDGCFDYNFKDGKILFRVTSSYIDSIVGKEVLDYVFCLAAAMASEYNDKIFSVIQNDLTVEQIYEIFKGDE